MHIYLDTADKNEIIELMKWGSFSGITTNPIILRNSGLTPEEAIKELAPLFKGGFFVQTWGETCSEMIQNAEKAAELLGERAIIKVPVTKDGLETIKALSGEGVKTAATALFTPGQALLAREAGANILIPFYNRIEEAGQDAIRIIELIRIICKDEGHDERALLVASLKKTEQIIGLIPLKIDAITIPPSLARELLKSPLTDKIVGLFKGASQNVEE